ncbi:UvrD-helicase domain-containing protein [Baaleninema sp.]|uniref:UvrD-helicase domain-containing protein n=1 Tax=Baaleninema sp. TaxID=3101197 RepID=UPI003CFD5403
MYSSKLNPEQKAIIDRLVGTILVLAPVGTGKTSVLAERVVRAIREGVDPKRILCLTFTNRAAKEMKERLSLYCPDRLPYLTIKTFHGLCASILRFEAHQFGIPQNFLIYDDSDCTEIVKEVFRVSKEREAQQLFFEIEIGRLSFEPADLSECTREGFGRLQTRSYNTNKEVF